MSTEFINDQWRLPNNENKDKQSNYSMDFDGSQYVDTGFNGLNNASQITISFWLNTSNLSQNAHFLGNRASNNGLSSQFFTDGNTYIHLNSQSFSFNSSTYFSNNTWHNFVIVFDGSLTATNRLKAYVDNTLITFGSVSSTNLLSSASGLFIGYSSSGGYFNGKLDGVSIFNYALSSSQVTTLYGSSSTGIGNPMTLNPVAYYPLGDQDAFNGANYLVPNSSLKDYVFDFVGAGTSSSGPHINLGNDSSLSPSSEITVSIWIKTDSNSPLTASGYLDKYSGGGYLLDFGGSSGTNKAGIKFGSSGTRITSTTVVADQKWHNILFTCDNTTLRFYVDGNEEVTSSATIADLTSTKNLKIGGDGSSIYFFDGKTSNFQIFNTALPATGSNSVETLYNNGSPLTSMSGFTSLQGWWKLDASATYDSSTTTWSIPDDSTNSNTGTSSGMTQANLVQSDLSFTSGYSPYALDFDSASSDYISASTSGLPTSDYTFSAWVKISSFGGDYGVLGYGDYSTSRGSNAFRFESSPVQLKNYWYGDDFNHNLTTSEQAAILNNWSHVVVTYDSSIGTYGQRVMYLNGNQIATNSPTGAAAFNLQNFTIGKTRTNEYFNGSMSNVSIWNTSLTSSQVTEIYSEGIPQNLLNHSAASSLVSWWQLGSNSSFNTNWTVLDEVTASGNNGTSVNMTEDAIVDGVGSYANGLSSGMGGDEVVGDAPYSSSNALSVNMDVEDRVTDTPS